MEPALQPGFRRVSRQAGATAIHSPSRASSGGSPSPFQSSRARACSCTQVAVGVQRIVVEENELPDAGGTRERDRLGDARVAPPDTVDVLALEVLRVVEEDVRILGDACRRRSSRASTSARSAPSAGSWSGMYASTRAVRLDPIADGRPGVRDLGGASGGAPPIVHGSSGTSWKTSCDGTSDSWHREERRREVDRRSAAPGSRTGDDGPQMCTSSPRLARAARRSRAPRGGRGGDASGAMMNRARRCGSSSRPSARDAGAGVEHEDRAVVEHDLDDTTCCRRSATVSRPGVASEPRHPHTRDAHRLRPPRRC